jgi:hypothetical protein
MTCDVPYLVVIGLILLIRKIRGHAYTSPITRFYLTQLFDCTVI